MTRFAIALVIALGFAASVAAQEKTQEQIALYQVGDIIHSSDSADVVVVYAAFVHKTKVATLRVVSSPYHTNGTEYSLSVEGDNTYQIHVGHIRGAYPRQIKPLVMQLVVEGISVDGIMNAHKSYKQR